VQASAGRKVEAEIRVVVLDMMKVKFAFGNVAVPDETGLGGVRTHNQPLKRAIVTICEMLFISTLQMPYSLLLRLLLRILESGQEGQCGRRDSRG